MRFLLFCSIFLLGACTWETYQGADGKTHMRNKYNRGERVVYSDGAYSQNQQYNQFRPEPHVIQLNDAK